MSRFYVEQKCYALRLRSGALIPFRATEVRDWGWIGVSRGRERIVPMSAIEWAEVISLEEMKALEEAKADVQFYEPVVVAGSSADVTQVSITPIKRSPGRPRKLETEI